MSRSLEEIKQGIRDKGVIKNERIIHETALIIYKEERVIQLDKKLLEVYKQKLRKNYGN